MNLVQGARDRSFAGLTAASNTAYIIVSPSGSSPIAVPPNRIASFANTSASIPGRTEPVQAHPYRGSCSRAKGRSVPAVLSAQYSSSSSYVRYEHLLINVIVFFGLSRHGPNRSKRWWHASSRNRSCRETGWSRFAPRRCTWSTRRGMLASPRCLARTSCRGRPVGFDQPFSCFRNHVCRCFTPIKR